jgi:hypothetical protein
MVIPLWSCTFTLHPGYKDVGGMYNFVHVEHFCSKKQYQQRLSALEGTSVRCKLSIISQSTTDIKECVKPEALQPYSHHFHPDTLLSPASSQKNSRGLDPRRVGTPHVAVSAVPLANQVTLPSLAVHKKNAM